MNRHCLIWSELNVRRPLRALAKRLARTIGTVGVLCLCSSAVYAQVVVDVQPDESSVQAGTRVNIRTYASWPMNYWGCWWPDLCRPGWVEVTISGTNGFTWADSYEISEWTTSESWSFGDSPTSPVSYYVSVMVWYEDREMGWWSGSETGSGSASVDVTPAAGPVTITGPDTVWWFGGENPSAYDTSITLSSDAGGPTEWRIIQGGNKAQLSSTSGGSVTVTPTGTISSGYPGDVIVEASAPGYTASSVSLTVRRPYRLVAGFIRDDCDQGATGFGYQTLLTYTIQDALLDDIPRPVPLNEQYVSDKDDLWPWNNWIKNNEMQKSFTTPAGDPARFADNISGGRRLDGSPYPVPGCGGNDTPVDQWEQSWQIGSLTIGGGLSVQLNTLERRLDFARHTNIRY